VIIGKWMLCLTLRVHKKDVGEAGATEHAIQLYDIKADRDCRENVWEANPEVAAKYRRLLIRWLGSGTGNSWKTESTVSQDEVERHLAELGYVSMADSDTTEWIDPECDCEWCSKFE